MTKSIFRISPLITMAVILVSLGGFSADLTGGSRDNFTGHPGPGAGNIHNTHPKLVHEKRSTRVVSLCVGINHHLFDHAGVGMADFVIHPGLYCIDSHL